ncbi:MAG: DUF1028 domain-containing protein [Planctomycetes bacterium]|nr:DUF1028 domain-containing protein [Planctomycetota bacterium]
MLRFAAFVVAAVAMLVSPLAATWSIVLIDLRTGEIAIAAATCLTNFDLMRTLPVLLVGRGAAVAQSTLDSDGSNRVLILSQLAAGTSPSQILAALALRDGLHEYRQYGIADLANRVADHTGTSVPGFADERGGRIGDLVWQIQGNLLTGAGVMDAIETAIAGTHQDLPARTIAAMEAAHAAGGDGRCSCDPYRPTACGSPPSNFTKSSHCAFMIVARPGDRDGSCGANGCANGSYFLSLNVANQPASAPDAVVQLRGLFDGWASARTGHPDHFTSTVNLARSSLPNDGVTSTTLRVALRDRSGTPLSGNNVNFTLHVEPSGATTLGGVTSRGNGEYDLRIVAGPQRGAVKLSPMVDDGSGAIRIGPPRTLDLVDDGLWCAQETISFRNGGTLEFVLRSPIPEPRLFSLLASASGSTPGIPLGPNVVLPLVPDLLLEATVSAWYRGLLPGLYGIAPASGRTTTSVSFPPGLWGLPPGLETTWAVALWTQLDAASNPVTVRVVF